MLATFHGQNEKQATISSNTETLTLVQIPTTDPTAANQRTGIIIQQGAFLEVSGGSFDPWATAYISNWGMTENSGTYSFTAYPRDYNNSFVGLTNYNNTTGIVNFWNHHSIKAWEYRGNRPGIGARDVNHTYNTNNVIRMDINTSSNPGLTISFYKDNIIEFSYIWSNGFGPSSPIVYPYVAMYGHGQKMTLTKNS